MDERLSHWQPDNTCKSMGTLHGGILCDIADAAMGNGVCKHTRARRILHTIELKINFFRPVWEARLRAEASGATGQHDGYIEVEITI